MKFAPFIVALCAISLVAAHRGTHPTYTYMPLPLPSSGIIDPMMPTPTPYMTEDPDATVLPGPGDEAECPAGYRLMKDGKHCRLIGRAKSIPPYTANPGCPPFFIPYNNRRCVCDPCQFDANGAMIKTYVPRRECPLGFWFVPMRRKCFMCPEYYSLRTTMCVQTKIIEAI